MSLLTSPPQQCEKKLGRPARLGRNELLDVAERLFAEKGFSATTIRDFAKHAKCNLALINYHFGSKEGLYDAVILRYFERARETHLESLNKSDKSSFAPGAVAKAWPELTDAAERSLCAALYGFGVAMIGNIQMQKILCMEMMMGGERVISALLKTDLGMAGVLRKNLDALIHQNKLRSDLDIKFAIVSIMGPFVYTCVASPVFKELYGFKSLDEEYVRQLCIHQTRTVFHRLRSR